MESDKSDPVLVTGATGFVGSHCIKQLLDAGYKVRGTVRSLHSKDKYAFLYRLSPQKNHNLELVEADLLDRQSWDHAVKGCKLVLHVASPFILGNIKEENLIRPAVEGSLNVLEACLRQGVKKVVVTSSMATMWYGNFDKIVNERDWSKEKYCPPYEKSKLLAEKAVWQFWQKHRGNIEITTINPGLIFGPVLASTGGSSEEIMIDLIMGNVPGVPNSGFGFVDVRDVALAHIRAMESKHSDGQRYLCEAESMWFKDLADILYKEFRPQGYKCVSRVLPNILVRVGSPFEPKLKNALVTLNKLLTGDNSKIRSELGMKFRSVRLALLDMGYSLIEQGAIPDKRIIKRSKL